MTPDQLAALSLVAQQALSGTPLSALVLGLVQFFKKTGVTGKPLTWLSMGLGVLIGGIYMVAVSDPRNLLAYFLCLVYGLLLGLMASGVYDVVASAGYKAAGALPPEKPAKNPIHPDE